MKKVNAECIIETKCRELLLHCRSVKPLGTANMQHLRKSEDVEQSFPILDLIETLGGLSALRHPGCEAHVFCEMARLGSTPAANMVQKTLWSMANE
jgi:hypothetical protein